MVLANLLQPAATISRPIGEGMDDRQLSRRKRILYRLIAFSIQSSMMAFYRQRIVSGTRKPISSHPKAGHREPPIAVAQYSYNRQLEGAGQKI